MIASDRLIHSERGSAVVDVVIAAAMVVFVLLPVFSLVMEKYILIEKSRIIRDAVDLTNISAYNALNTGRLGRVDVALDRAEILGIYKSLLSANLNLDDDLAPKKGSVAEGRVAVESLEIYMSGFPAECPSGDTIIMPTVHSIIQVPVMPSLYRSVVLKMLGRDQIELEVHVDSEIPLNH